MALEVSGRLSPCCLQEEYIREQIDWREIIFADNQPCINLISLKPYGILRILDDQCCFPQVTCKPCEPGNSLSTSDPQGSLYLHPLSGTRGLEEHLFLQARDDWARTIRKHHHI